MLGFHIVAHKVVGKGKGCNRALCFPIVGLCLVATDRGNAGDTLVRFGTDGSVHRAISHAVSGSGKYEPAVSNYNLWPFITLA